MNAKETIDQARRGLGCLGKSAEDEPVFVLVARDLYGANVVRAWADLVEARAAATGGLTGQRQAKVAGARRVALEMDAWCAAYGGGVIPE